IGLTTLRNLFPRENALLVAMYRVYRFEQKERRIALACALVRQETISLHMQGMNPSYNNVASLLPRAGMLRNSKARRTWHAVRRELGLE
ncbi:MAG: hypothetical protein ACXVDN_10400, partial [Ktedonobacteraceae bacterium]